MGSNTKANKSSPSTIAAGDTDTTKIAGLPLLALMAAAQQSPCKMPMKNSATPTSTPTPNRPGEVSTATGRLSVNMMTMP
jgi:hypothetical protein